MKKLFFLSIFLMLMFFASAQVPFSIGDGEPVLVYALPKTEFLIDLQIEKTTQKPGMFYRYSERYLATNKVVTDEKTTYKIKSIVVRTRSVADPNRTFAIKLAKNSALNNLTVTADGLLCGVNVAPPTKLQEAPLSLTHEDASSRTLLPLGEEYMMAGSESKLAEGAAKQIYRIRESRLGLLTADVEKLPADGVSLKSMLEGLNKMEQSLTELFVGQVTTEVQTQTLSFIPDASVSKQVLFRLSSLRGLVASDDLSGAPVFVSINPVNNATLASVGTKEKTDKSGVYTVLPVSCQLLIEDGVKSLFTGEYSVPQFGRVIPIPDALFSQPKSKIHIDSETGRLLGAEQ